MKLQYFGTDGVRGPFGGPVVNESFVARLTQAAAGYFRDRGAVGPVLIARDTRASGAALARAVAGGAGAAGFETLDLGIIPTPAVALAVRRQGAAFGAMITASHNPAADNGLKFFDASGFKLGESAELEIERRLGAIAPAPLAATAPGRDGLADYRTLVTGLLPPGALRGMRVVLDTANGATCVTSPQVLRELGAEVIGLGDAPNGSNINAGVGSEHPEALAARVLETRAAIGVAHDGDGDRCILVDEKGSVVDGDEVLVMLALDALRRDALPHRTLVVTVQSNLGVDFALQKAGGQVVRTPVGDRHVAERMRADGLLLGGESSGHIICGDITPAGDGLVAALKVLSVMRARGAPLSELRQALVKAPQKSSALKVAVKKPLETLTRLPAEIAALERELGSTGRVLVRYSGTEPKLRLLVEGPSDGVVSAGLARLVAAARADLEVLS